jgi:selenocysteine lyase/cysteine desulfurase
MDADSRTQATASDGSPRPRPGGGGTGEGRFARRTLLTAAAASAAALAGATGCRSGDRPGSGAKAREAAGVGAEFDLDRTFVQLTTFLLASHVRPVRAAIRRHRRALDRNPTLYVERKGQHLDERAQRAAARYLGTAPELVALTDSTTMGLGLLYGGLDLRPGDDVLTSEHDFYSTHESLRLAASRTGASVRKIALYRNLATVSTDEIVSAVVAAVRPQTRYVALTWVHSSTGLKLPIREIANGLADVNERRDEGDRVLLCVDGVHGFGVENVAIGALGCDFFSSGCHKWLFGPRGTGVLWGSNEAWRRHSPTIPSFAREAVGGWLEGRKLEGPPGALETPGGFHSFEHRWALGDAFEWHRQRGRGRIARHTRALAARLKRGLRQIPGVDVKTPMSSDLSAGLVCAALGDRDAADVVERLLREHRIVASVTPYRVRYVRFGPSVANDADDVDAAIAAMAKVARR